MLKIGKSKKNNEIFVELRQPFRVFDRTFLLALTTAISLHLFAAILFHVRLFSWGGVETILPATNTDAYFVKSSAEEKDAIVTSQIDKEGRLTPAQMAPLGTSPSIPGIIPLHVASVNNIYLTSMGNNPFLEIEKDVEESYFSQNEIPFISSNVKISVSGLIAELPFTIRDQQLSALFELQKFPSDIRQDRIVYHVDIDSNSGEVFWFYAEQNALNKKQLILAEKLLKNLLFKIPKDEFIQTGQIEITFTSYTDEDWNLAI